MIDNAPLLLPYGLYYVDWSHQSNILQFHNVNGAKAEQFITIDKVISTASPRHPIDIVNTSGINEDEYHSHPIEDRRKVATIPSHIAIMGRAAKDQCIKAAANIESMDVGQAIKLYADYANALNTYYGYIYKTCKRYEMGDPK